MCIASLKQQGLQNVKKKLHNHHCRLATAFDFTTFFTLEFLRPHPFFTARLFLNQTHVHSWPKAGCGRMPGLLKFRKMVCTYLPMFVCTHPREQNH